MGFITDILKDIPLSAVIREKLIDAEKKITVFEKQNKELVSQLEKATHKIQSLEKLNQKLQGATYQEEEKLDKVTEQILQQFFETDRELSSEYFVSTLSLKINVVKYHFDILIDNGYIDHASTSRSFITNQSSTTYSIAQKGREYIIKNT